MILLVDLLAKSYLEYLNFSSLSEGIMAYNFGGGRLRQLKREKTTGFKSTYIRKI